MSTSLRKVVISSQPRLQRTMHVGQILTGRKARYRLAEALQDVDGAFTVFKADVVRNDKSMLPVQTVVVKTAAPGHDASRDGLIREYRTYQIPKIAASKHIRKMYDIIGDPMEMNHPDRREYPSLVLEWFDATLHDISPDTHRQNLPLLYAIIQSVLSSSATCYYEKLTNTDLKPDNILISQIDSKHPLVKVGDLGSVYNDGEAFECQPFAMRSPEVWRGLACQHRSEIWALAAMLLVWIEPQILGTAGINGYITPQIWSIAKLMNLFPGWHGPPSDRGVCKDEFDIASMLATEEDVERPWERRVKVPCLEEAMSTMQIPTALQDFLRSLLKPDPAARPTALEALASKEYSALRKSASNA